MADLTALDMARVYANELHAKASSVLEQLLLGEPSIDRVASISIMVRECRSKLDLVADQVFTLNRELRGTDEAIQKQQMLYRKQQEREAEAARVAALEAELKPAPFSLD